MFVGNITKRFVRAGVAVVASLGCVIAPVSAMRVSPMVVEMETVGSDAVARIEVQNVNPGKLAFQTRVYRLEMKEDGSVVETPADDQFLIFPPQGALPPSGRQVIRLQWVGDPQLATSQAFYISVEQLPIAFDPVPEDAVAAQVQVLYNMRALVVVAPPGAQPDVSPTSVRQVLYQPPAAPGADELPPQVEALEIVLRNDGRRHAMMSNFGWKLEGQDSQGQWLRVDLSPEELTTAIGTGYVPAQGERKFYLPVSGFNAEPISLAFKR